MQLHLGIRYIGHICFYTGLRSDVRQIELFARANPTLPVIIEHDHEQPHAVFAVLVVDKEGQYAVDAAGNAIILLKTVAADLDFVIFEHSTHHRGEQYKGVELYDWAAVTFTEYKDSLHEMWLQIYKDLYHMVGDGAEGPGAWTEEESLVNLL